MARCRSGQRHRTEHTPPRHSHATLTGWLMYHLHGVHHHWPPARASERHCMTSCADAHSSHQQGCTWIHGLYPLSIVAGIRCRRHAAASSSGAQCTLAHTPHPADLGGLGSHNPGGWGATPVCPSMHSLRHCCWRVHAGCVHEGRWVDGGHAVQHRRPTLWQPPGIRRCQ